MQATATRSLPETPVSGLPAGLAEMPPGPGLGAVLACVDLGALTGAEVVTVLQAEYRQSAHQRARVLAAAYETGMRRPLRTEFDRLESPDEFSSDEVRAALGLTRSAATKLFDLAYQTMSRLPELHEAMAAGELDEPRARVLADWTADLRDAHARDICGELLPRVVPPATEDDPVALTTGQLIDEIKTLAIALDPDWARRRYENALQERDVRGRANPDGTADITGRQLPVDRVAAACGRIDALARSAKSSGDPRRISHLRAELFLGMTDGTYEGLTDAQILAHLAANRPAPPDEEASAAAQPQPAPGAEPAGETEQAGETERAAESVAPRPQAQPDAEPASEARAADASGLAVHEPSRAGVELRVRLSTLLGLDRYPAELSGWGPMHAELARDLAIELGPAQWRYALTDAEGLLIRAGLTPARPNAVRLRAAHSRAIVEIQVPATLLADLTGGELAARFTGDPEALARWRPLIADIARRARDPEHAGPPEDPGRRFPGAALRREIEIRIARCVAPGCLVPAARTDLDHEVDHARGGLTTTENLAPKCRHDHRLKHEGGWAVRRVGHQFSWTSRLGRAYTVPIAPIIRRLPDPRPGPLLRIWPELDPDRDGHRHWSESSGWDPGPRAAPESSRPPPPLAISDEPPF